MCYFLDWTTENTINLIIAIGTLLTAGFTWGLIRAANKGFSKIYSQEASKYQMKTMLDLITVMGKDKIKVYDAINTYEFLQGPIHDKSILEYVDADLLNIPLDNEMYSRNEIQSMSFEFIEMPILPSSVAKRLKELRDLPRVDFHFSGVLGTKHFYIIQDIPPQPVFVSNVVKKYTQGYSGYILACLNLKNSIIDWFSKHGVSDLNSDFIPL